MSYRKLREYALPTLDAVQGSIGGRQSTQIFQAKSGHYTDDPKHTAV